MICPNCQKHLDFIYQPFWNTIALCPACGVDFYIEFDYICGPPDWDEWPFYEAKKDIPYDGIERIELKILG